MRSVDAAIVIVLPAGATAGAFVLVGRFCATYAGLNTSMRRPGASELSTTRPSGTRTAVPCHARAYFAFGPATVQVPFSKISGACGEVSWASNTRTPPVG